MSRPSLPRRVAARLVPDQLRPLIHWWRTSGYRRADEALLAALRWALDRKGPTPLDVFFAYRLLLNRSPDRQGFTSYGRQIRGHFESVEELVDEFLGSTEFAERRQARSAELSRPAWESTPVAEEVVRLPEFSIVVDRHDTFIGQAIKRRGEYEHFVSAVLRQLLRPGQTFVDVGANIGYFSLLAAKQVGPTGHVVACEPAPPNFALLSKSVQLNGFDHVELHAVAVTDAPRMVQIIPYERRNSGSFHLLNRADATGAYEVEGRPLDDVVGERKVDVIKIDIEGAEGLALRGMRRVLERSRPVLLMEYSPSSLADISHMTGNELLGDLAALGYDVQDAEQFDPGRRQTAGELGELLQRRETDHLDLVFTPRVATAADGRSSVSQPP